MIKRLLSVLLAMLLLPSVSAVASEPQVLASIKPLALIVAEIADSAEPLLPAGASHHEFSLKVSDMRRLRQADLVLWVGPGLEDFLHKTLAAKPARQVLQLDKLEGLHWPEAKTVQQHGHHHGRDYHVWLNPLNAAVIAKALAARLGELAPERADIYSARAEVFAEQMHRLDAQLRAELAPVKDRGFVVYHDAYNHFVARYGLRQLDYITLTPERRPGARHIYHLQEVLEEAQCLFIEPGAEDATVRTLSERSHLTRGVLDPLGGSANIERFGQLLQTMASSLSTCLGQRHS